MTFKIAYILKMYPRFSETFIVNEILELERQGVEVIIYSLRKPDDGRFHAKLAQVKASVIYAPQYPDKEPERVEAAQDYLYARYPVPYLRWHEYALSRGNPYAVKRFQQACVIAAHLLQNPVHAMHAHFASSAARVANYIHGMIGLPYSITAHAKDIYHQDVRPESLRKKMQDARFVVTVSQYNQHYLQNLLGDAPADIRCLYNGIDLGRFRPDAASSSQPNLILGVGRLVEKKGFDTLIRACAILQEQGVDFQCHIIGKGGLRKELAALIAELNLDQRVQLLGAKPQDGVLAAYKEAAVFALPCVIGSDGNRDGLPTVLLEAMAAGLPAVSTPVTGIPEIIDDGENGRLVPPGDAAALAEALAEMLQNPQQRRQMALAARQKVEHLFDVRLNVAQLHKWLAEPTAVDPKEAAHQPHPLLINSPYSPVAADTVLAK